MDDNDCINKAFDADYHETAILPKIVNQECSACHANDFDNCALLYKLLSTENENAKQFKKLFEGITEEQKKQSEDLQYIKKTLKKLKAGGQL